MLVNLISPVEFPSDYTFLGILAVILCTRIGWTAIWIENKLKDPGFNLKQNQQGKNPNPVQVRVRGLSPHKHLGIYEKGLLVKSSKAKEDKSGNVG